MPKGHTVKVKEVWKLGSIFATSFVVELLSYVHIVTYNCLIQTESFYVDTLNMSKYVQCSSFFDEWLATQVMGSIRFNVWYSFAQSKR